MSPSPQLPSIARKGWPKVARYRLRTKLREHLPWRLAQLAPKGADCYDHEWYLEAPGEWACYHCQQTTTKPPTSEASWVRQRLSAIYLEMAEMTRAIEGLDVLEAEREHYEPELATLWPRLLHENEQQETLEEPADRGVVA